MRPREVLGLARLMLLVGGRARPGLPAQSQLCAFPMASQGAPGGQAMWNFCESETVSKTGNKSISTSFSPAHAPAVSPFSVLLVPAPVG